jgi:hypothetical protein
VLLLVLLRTLVFLPVLAPLFALSLAMIYHYLPPVLLPLQFLPMIYLVFFLTQQTMNFFPPAIVIVKIGSLVVVIAAALADAAIAMEVVALVDPAIRPNTLAGLVVVPVAVAVAVVVAVLEGLLCVGVSAAVDFVIQLGIHLVVDVYLAVPLPVLGPVETTGSIGCLLLVAVAVAAAMVDLVMVDPAMADSATPVGIRLGVVVPVAVVPVAAAVAADSPPLHFVVCFRFPPSPLIVAASLPHVLAMPRLLVARAHAVCSTRILLVSRVASSVTPFGCAPVVDNPQAFVFACVTCHSIPVTFAAPSAGAVRYPALPAPVDIDRLLAVALLLVPVDVVIDQAAQLKVPPPILDPISASLNHVSAAAGLTPTLLALTQRTGPFAVAMFFVPPLSIPSVSVISAIVAVPVVNAPASHQLNFADVQLLTFFGPPELLAPVSAPVLLTPVVVAVANAAAVCVLPIHVAALAGLYLDFSVTLPPL